MTDVSLWWIALAFGALVLIIALALLQTFLDQLHAIEDRADAIWKAGKQVARNTATSWQLDATSEGLDALTSEALRHDAFLRTGVPQDGGQS